MKFKVAGRIISGSKYKAERLRRIREKEMVEEIPAPQSVPEDVVSEPVTSEENEE